MVALDKLIGASEAYARANPDDVRSYVSLNAAYNNAALMFDDSMPRDEAHRRGVALLRRAIAADEKLITLEPDNPKRHLSLAETRFNLGDGLYHTAQYPEAIAVFRQAAAVMRTGIDRNDARGQWMRTMVNLGLAKSLVKVGGYDEAGILFADAEKYLLAREISADTLHIQFALAIAGIRGGEMYGALAGAPRLSVAEQLAYWRKARESLAQGVEKLKKLGESIALAGPEKEMMDDGVAGLARAEAAIVGLR
jgi:tetratricopeptide (TPR) repeat protein